MNLLYNYNNIADFSEKIAPYAEQYQHMILIVLLIIALLNCFFGFHLRKLWGILAGMFIGAFISAEVCIYIEKTGTILYLAAIIGAFMLGLLALLLYRAGLFFICALVIPLILSHLLPSEKTETIIFWIILGIVAGIMTLVWEREVISTITALGGGFGSAKCIALIQNHQSSLMIFMIGLALTLAGLLIQFQPWRSRSAWNSDEERARDKHRHKRRMKRIRRKKKDQERAAQRRKGEKPTLHRHIRNRESTEYTPYTTRPIYRQTLAEQQPPAYRQTASFEPDSYETDLPDRKAVMGNPDLSDIRQHISREVSDIYRDQQNETDYTQNQHNRMDNTLDQQDEMDNALDQLLEQEYRNTTRSLRNSGRHKRTGEPM